MVLTPSLASAKVRICPRFHLKTDDGKIINPLTGEKPAEAEGDQEES